MNTRLVGNEIWVTLYSNKLDDDPDYVSVDSDGFLLDRLKSYLFHIIEYLTTVKVSFTIEYNYPDSSGYTNSATIHMTFPSSQLAENFSNSTRNYL